ncbi:HD family phosphohydrolase [Arenibacter latericius]|uniref:HD family phosphohydrolase n=1 Tax=Arenibacter latericius TaxID=86104 RepID=UPI000428D546|nr:HDIG domain-containing metalloprotein [Arenibacter latericius]MDX1364870.1 HDIG domain-containing protein [Arenibacter latericius]
MRTFLDRLYKNQSLVYKYFLYFFTVFVIVFFFPRGGKFKYEFQKGKPWQYDNFYAPFDFSINKGEAEINKEKEKIRAGRVDYYNYDEQIVKEVDSIIQLEIPMIFDDGNYSYLQINQFQQVAKEMVDELYNVGILSKVGRPTNRSSLYLLKNNEAKKLPINSIYKLSDVSKVVENILAQKNLSKLEPEFQQLFFSTIKPNLSFNEDLSNKELEAEFSKISYRLGNVDEGKLIIAKGEVVEEEDLRVLESLKSEYESKLWGKNNQYYVIFGYTVLVAMVLTMLFLFLKKYRYEVFQDNTKITFIVVNILLMVFVTTIIVKYNESLVFVVPLCILPLILKTFFDARLGLFVHVLTVLILGFVVPNSYEYIFLQTLAGIVTILSVSELYKRANLFISVGQITLIYIVGYFAFHMIHEGNIDDIQWMAFGFFLLNGMITLFVQPLIYVFEKIFGLVSDVSLLELSDTNSKLLKELSNRAPGTFHHSLQVANLAEAAANEIGANAMLVRVGALYHDIGKMNNPTYFTENQITNVNPHDDLEPIESGRIIIDHVIQGIEIARKNNVPDRVIDFIRTHHGTSLVYYFYKKQKALQEEIGGEVNDADFRYPGPAPFSRETAILMMADSVEAASKSLKNPSFTGINDFVEKIVNGQISENQFLNANITFKEIETIKKVLKQKLINIYHLRVEYPE